MSNKTIVYLAELSHNGFGLSLNTVPLGIGLIGSYCKKIHKDSIELHLFREFDELQKAVENVKPHVVGLGAFSWNENLTTATADYIRRVSPETLIAIGGGNVSADGWDKASATKLSEKSKLTSVYAREADIEVFNANPGADILIHGDGEVPFANLVASFQALGSREKVRENPSDGCSSYVNGELLTGNPTAPIWDLDEIPSPYITGIYDELFAKHDLLPQIETVRGCPYECTYCTIGGYSNKLRKHSFEYVKAEILYLKENSPNRVLRIADSNWGILKSDIEVARFIKKLHEEENYPTSVRVYYAENGPFENVKTMAEELKSVLPLNMSFQTLTPTVLSEIKRKNMAKNKVLEMVAFAHDKGIAVSTELISGLPLETAESFKETFMEVVKLNFDSIYEWHLYLIKGSELYFEEARKKYGFETMYALIGKNVTKVGDKYVIEADEVVVQSKDMSHEDFWDLARFRLFIYTTYGAGFFKEMFMNCMDRDITPYEIYNELSADNGEKYPSFYGVSEEYVNSLKGKYFKSFEELQQAVEKALEDDGDVDEFGLARWLLYLVGRTLSSARIGDFVNDVSNAALAIHKRKSGGEAQPGFVEELEILTRLSKEIIIAPIEETKENVTFECDYDLTAWAKNLYKNPLGDYRSNEPKKYILQVRNYREHQDLYNRACDFDEIDKYTNYFQTMVSSNMRRIILPAGEE